MRRMTRGVTFPVRVGEFSRNAKGCHCGAKHTHHLIGLSWRAWVRFPPMALTGLYNFLVFASSSMGRTAGLTIPPKGYAIVFLVKHVKTSLSGFKSRLAN